MTTSSREKSGGWAGWWRGLGRRKSASSSTTAAPTSATYPKIANQDVVVDGNRYERTVFTNCTLVYRGGRLPVFVRCTFRQVKIRLEGQALQTTQYMQTLYGLGLIPAVEKVFDGIQQDALPLSEYPLPPPAVNLGQNYGQLAVNSLVLTVVAGLLGAALWYGFLFYPTNVALARDPAQPLVKSAVYDLMPALPDDLAVTYDQWKADQIELLGSYGWVDQANGIAHIPVETAMDLLAEQGLPTETTGGN